MSVTVESFGKFPSGEEVKRFRLTGKNGLTASFLNYGATLQALEFDGKDLVLGLIQLNNTAQRPALIKAQPSADSATGLPQGNFP